MDWRCYLSLRFDGWIAAWGNCVCVSVCVCMFVPELVQANEAFTDMTNRKRKGKVVITIPDWQPLSLSLYFCICCQHFINKSWWKLYCFRVQTSWYYESQTAELFGRTSRIHGPTKFPLACKGRQTATKIFLKQTHKKEGTHANMSLFVDVLSLRNWHYVYQWN